MEQNISNQENKNKKNNTGLIIAIIAAVTVVLVIVIVLVGKSIANKKIAEIQEKAEEDMITGAATMLCAQIKL